MSLRDRLSDLAQRLREAPPWVKALLALGTVAMVATLSDGPVALDERPILALPEFRKNARRKVAIVRWLLEEWSREGTLTREEQAILLAVVCKESGFNIRAVSPAGAPDARGGNAWGLFQFLATTLAHLDSAVAEVTPIKGTDGTVSDAEAQRATRAAARVAVVYLTRPHPRWANGSAYLDAIRALHPGDPIGLAREVFTAWNAGPARRWSDIAAIPSDPRPGSLGYVHLTVAHKLEVLPAFRAALGLLARPTT